MGELTTVGMPYQPPTPPNGSNGADPTATASPRILPRPRRRQGLSPHHQKSCLLRSGEAITQCSPGAIVPFTSRKTNRYVLVSAFPVSWMRVWFCGRGEVALILGEA